MTHTHALPPRRHLLAAAASLAALSACPAVLAATPSAAPLSVQVWKSPACGCCKDWVAHLQAAGFRVQVFEEGNTAKRAQLGLPQKYGSCHTALIDGYVIEGHVPAADVKRLLKERPPQALGLAVPGMPLGSPGMDGPDYGGQRDAYDVLLVRRDGSSRVFASHQ